MKHLITVTITILCLLVLVNCKQKEATSSTGEYDSLPSTVAEGDEADTSTSVPTESIIKYNINYDDPVRLSMMNFPPLASVLSLAGTSIHIKDSLEIARETQELTSPADSLVFRPSEIKAYQAILDYQQALVSGIQVQDECPGLFQLNRTVEAGDSSSSILPEAGKSQLLAHGKFFFLGGSPFIYRIDPAEDEVDVYTDPSGMPETRFDCSITENTNYLLNSLYHFKSEPTKLTFGPPVSSYESGPQEVNGIGLLVHEFTNRIPVLFLTETGVVPAHMISITVKIAPENLGCISDSHRIKLACPENIDASDILAVYIPYNSAPVTSFAVSHPNKRLWTADLNNDGIPDLAKVSCSFEGISDVIAEVLWFVNINGTWKIIDWGVTPDCT